jgi:hypothetical protein
VVARRGRCHPPVFDAAAELARQASGASDLALLASWVLTVSRLRGVDRVQITVAGTPREIEIAEHLTVAKWLAAVAAQLRGAPAQAATDDVLLFWGSETGPSRFESGVNAGHDAGSLGVDYPAGSSAEGFEILVSTWAYLLGELVTHPHTELGSLSSIDVAQRRRLLEEFNDTGWTYDGPMSVPGRFSAVVSTHGARVAVAWEEETLTYAELDRAANALTAELRDAGVAAGDIVALALGRSAESIIAMLAVLKLGAAYLPVDLKYPADRLAFMLRDSGVHVLVAREAPAEPPAGIITMVFSGIPVPKPQQLLPLVESDRARLRDVHLGFDRRTQGRGDSASRHPASHDAVRLHDVGRFRPHASCRASGLRRVDARDLGSAAQRRRLRAS